MANGQAQQSSVRQPLLLPENSIAEESRKLSPEKLSIDDVLSQWAGELGPAQILHFGLVSLVWCVQCMLTFAMVFADQTPQWECAPSTLLINNTDSSYPHQLTPLCTSSSSICSLDPSLWQWVHGAGESTVSQWRLICNDSYKVGLVQCLFFVGTLLGAGICGSLSDSFLGRKGVLVVVSSLGAILGTLTAFAPNYWVYVALRVATGFSVGGMGTPAFLLATESVGPSRRGPASMSIFFFYACAMIIISSLAYLNPSWRQIYLLVSVPAILYCLVILPFVSESPRWYLAHGKADAALAILRRIALRNGRCIPPTISLLLEDATLLQDVVPTKIVDVTQERRTAGTMNIFRISSMRTRMMMMLFIWLSNGMCYFGINLNVANVGGSTSLGLILNAVGEMPAYLITAVMLQKYGRRPSLICALLFSGLSCLGGAIARGTTMRMVCSMMAIVGVAAGYNVVYIYTAELFPTEVRNAAMGLAALAAQVGSVASPLVAMASHIHEWLPFSIFCVGQSVSLCLAWFLAETLDKQMHETIEGMLK